MEKSSTLLYRFMGIHSLLIGLFPFYVPVYLWKSGWTLSDLSYFISVSAFGFCISLWIWDRLQMKISLRKIIAVSLGLETILLGAIVFQSSSFFFPVFALFNGFYGCFFWTTQRILFLESVSSSTSGRHYGNLQILVAVSLKTGILIGGLLLESVGFEAVFAISGLITVTALISIHLTGYKISYSPEMSVIKPLTLKEIIGFRDQVKSRFIFVLDGLFLFLESYFWLISIFLLVRQSYLGLGAIMIGLMALFAVLFWFIKNSIDRLPLEPVFRLSVGLYAVSWVLRGFVFKDTEEISVAIMLILIAFFTTFFRLTFNKRFFDFARKKSSHSYLLLKSYYSQAAIIIWFGVIGLTTRGDNEAEWILRIIYWSAAVLATGYFAYGARKQRPVFNSTSTGNQSLESLPL